MNKKVNFLSDGRKIKLGMVQINNSFSNQNYLPYSLGCLQTYAQTNVPNIDRFEFSLPIYSRIPVKDAASTLLNSDMIFFSTYVWNIKISLEIAQKIKQSRPEVIMVFGGPQIPERIEDFLLRHRCIDIACHGEGEQVFASILENCESGNWDKVPSISYINNAGKLIQTPKIPRILDLARIPSPFLMGTFEPLMNSNSREEWIVMWETNRGCPFSCTFCDWGSATASKVYRFDMERLFKDIDWFTQHKIEFVFCCDANFGIFPRDLDIVKYLAENKRKHGYPKAFSVQNTKNSTIKSYEIQKVLAEAGLNKGVTLSMQSVDDNTLKHIKRANIKTTVYQELQQKFTADNIETYTDIILGLPAETYETFVNGVSTVMENGQHNRIQFSNLSILPNAEMGNLEYQKKYGFVIQETDIINLHGSLAKIEEIMETQHLVVGTNTMPKPDWIKVRVFAWMTALLHFNKLLQIPFVVLHALYPIRYRHLIEIFTNEALRSPILSEILEFFTDKAIDIQNGGAEYCESKTWLNIWWPVDEYMLIKLCFENKLKLFYEESEAAIEKYLYDKNIKHPSALLHESLHLNQHLVKMPFENKNVHLNLSYNIFEIYQANLRGTPTLLKEGAYCYQINRESIIWSSWEDWFREVVWYGNKKGAYLYQCKAIPKDWVASNSHYDSKLKIVI